MLLILFISKIEAKPLLILAVRAGLTKITTFLGHIKKLSVAKLVEIF